MTPHVYGGHGLISDPATQTHSTALGGEIDPVFTQADLGGVPYLVIHVNGLADTDIATVDTESTTATRPPAGSA